MSVPPNATPCSPTAVLDGSIEDIIGRLYGAPMPTRGIVHVAAVWAAPDGSLPVLRIEPDTPASRVDAFVLDYARARADAIITTGKILRLEPELRYDLRSAHAAALLQWRTQMHSKLAPPHVVVLTRGEDLDLRHPAFSSWARPIVFTRERARAGLKHVRDDVDVIAVEEPSIRAAIAFSRETLAAQVVSIEAGPASTASLYEPDALGVDELLLSICHASTLRPSDLTAAFVTPDALVRDFEEPTRPVFVAESSAVWSFHRYVRKRCR